MKKLYTQKELKERFNLKKEALKFYINIGTIVKKENDVYEYDDKDILETNSVFKFYVESDLFDNLHHYARSLNLNSKVRIYTKEEINEINKGENHGKTKD